MSRKANPTVIGAFVIGAIALLAIGVVVFGGERFFQNKGYFVTYFDGSVKGLRVGSNVLFRGVRVGYVTDIRVTSDEKLEKFTVPVIFQMLPDAFTIVENGDEERLSMSQLGRANMRKALIERGLRSKLEIESYVTGQLVIQLDFYPEEPALFRGSNETPYPEIPSIESEIQQLLERVQRFVAEFQSRVDAVQLAKDVQAIVSGLNSLVNSPELRSAITGIDKLVNQENTQALPGSASEAFRSAQQTLKEARALIDNVDKGLAPALERAGPVLATLEKTLTATMEIMETAKTQLAADSELNYQLTRTLEQAQGAARSLRALSEYLEQHPEALLRGKQEEQ